MDLSWATCRNKTFANTPNEIQQQRTPLMFDWKLFAYHNKLHKINTIFYKCHGYRSEWCLTRQKREKMLRLSIGYTTIECTVEDSACETLNKKIQVKWGNGYEHRRKIHRRHGNIRTECFKENDIQREKYDKCSTRSSSTSVGVVVSADVRHSQHSQLSKVESTF